MISASYVLERKKIFRKGNINEISYFGGIQGPDSQEEFELVLGVDARPGAGDGYGIPSGQPVYQIALKEAGVPDTDSSGSLVYGYVSEDNISLRTPPRASKHITLEGFKTLFKGIDNEADALRVFEFTRKYFDR